MTTDTQALAARLARYAELKERIKTLEGGAVQFNFIEQRNILAGDTFQWMGDVCVAFPAMASDIALLQGVIAELVGALERIEAHIDGYCRNESADKTRKWDNVSNVASDAIDLASPLVAKGGEHE